PSPAAVLMPPRRPTLRMPGAGLLAALLFFGCEQVTVLTVEVASISVSPAQTQVAVGESTPLTAQLLGPSGAILSGRTVTWSSSDESRATVNANGVVQGIAPGPVQIRASAEGVTGSASVTVAAP